LVVTGLVVTVVTGSVVTGLVVTVVTGLVVGVVTAPVVAMASGLAAVAGLGHPAGWADATLALGIASAPMAASETSPAISE
jgi:hypothetical protein